MVEVVHPSLLDAQGSPPPEDLDGDVFCIGAAKSGSTWLTGVLQQHPEIQVSKPKETIFLTAYGSPYRDRTPDNFITSWEWYDSCFPEDAPVNIDFSIHTMADPEAPKRIHAVFPEARFLLILRDPVKRLYSHYKMEKRKKELGYHYRSSLPLGSKSSPVIGPYTDHGKIPENPQSTVQQTYRFLGVDDSFTPARINRKVHPIPEPRGLQRRLRATGNWGRDHGSGWLADSIGRWIPYRTVNRLDKKAKFVILQ